MTNKIYFQDEQSANKINDEIFTDRKIAATVSGYDIYQGAIVGKNKLTQLSQSGKQGTISWSGVHSDEEGFYIADPGILKTPLKNKIGNDLFVCTRASSILLSDLDKMIDLGLTGIRQSILWSTVQGNNIPCRFDYVLSRSIDWDGVVAPTHDKIIGEAISRGLKVMLILFGGNKYYTGIELPPPVTHAEQDFFAEYALQTVRFFCEKYGAENFIFEIYNEPNRHTFWPPDAKAEEFASLIKKTSEKIKLEAPDAVLSGPAIGHKQGGSEIDYEWTEAVLSENADAFSSLDFFTFHLYNRYGPEDFKSQIIKILNSLPHDIRGRCAVDETGYSTGSSFVPSEQDAANKLLRSYLLNQYYGLGFTAIYRFKNNGTDEQSYQDMFGLHDYNGNQRASAVLFGSFLSEMSGYTLLGRRICSNMKPEDYVLIYENGPILKAVMWGFSTIDYEGEVYQLTETPKVYFL